MRSRDGSIHSILKINRAEFFGKFWASAAHVKAALRSKTPRTLTADGIPQTAHIT